jgi:hypothetical protein
MNDVWSRHEIQHYYRVCVPYQHPLLALSLILTSITLVPHLGPYLAASDRNVDPMLSRVGRLHGATSSLVLPSERDQKLTGAKHFSFYIGVLVVVEGNRMRAVH